MHHAISALFQLPKKLWQCQNRPLLNIVKADQALAPLFEALKGDG